MLTVLAPANGDLILPLAAARTHLNLTASDTFHDAAVVDLRNAAIGWAEAYTGRSLNNRQFRWSVDYFLHTIRLPRWPVSAVTEIRYYDANGVDTAMALNDWYLGGDRLHPAHGSAWPYANGAPAGVRITFTAGYATAADIPPFLLAAVKLAMTALFENRSSPDLSAAERCANQFHGAIV